MVQASSKSHINGQLTAKHKLRILMLVGYFHPHYSGAAKQAICLAKELRNRGHYIEFVTVWRNDRRYMDVFEGFKVWRLKAGADGKYKEFGFWWNFVKFVTLHGRNFDIIHSHGATYFNSVVGPVSKLLRKKSVIKTTLANNDLFGLRQGIAGHIHYWFLRMVDGYVAISKELVKELRFAKLPRSKIVMIPNGVDIVRFRPAVPEEKKQLKRKFGLPEDKKLFLSVGVFDERKNIGWLVENWIDTNGFGTGCLLMAIGPKSREDPHGSMLAKVKKKAASAPDLARIIDYVEHIETYYRASDCFVLPSTSEGMPNVILEAMASGLPCISTKVSGVSSLVIEDLNGYTFWANDLTSLRKSIELLSTNDMQRMGKNSRHIAEKYFSLDAVAGKYEACYDYLAGKRLTNNAHFQ